MWKKILLGIALLSVAALGFLALSESKRADYWQNFRRTEPGRTTRLAKRRQEAEEPEQTEEEELAEMDRLMTHIEKRAEETKNQQSNDSQSV